MASSLNGSRAPLASARSTEIHVIGIGSGRLTNLDATAREHLASAVAFAGSAAQLDRVREFLAEPGPPQIVLGADMGAWLDAIASATARGPVVVFASGDPLFFGIGRVLLERFGREAIAIYPHISSVQLAFARLGIPWQNATVVSVHGRDPDTLEAALKQGKSPLAILTDRDWNPATIARAIRELRPMVRYRLWVCSALGSAAEDVTEIDPYAAIDREFCEPNVVVLQAEERAISPETLPLFGISDAEFCTFADRPGLLTKQEVRVLSLGLLQLQPGAIVWDIGAGTGSVSIEIARLVPGGWIYAIERTAAGLALIQKNCDCLGVRNVIPVGKAAPDAFTDLPDPDRIVLGGGGAKVAKILQACAPKLQPGGVLVGHFATLEACTTARAFLDGLGWFVQLLQVNLARSSPLPTRSGTPATRFVPLNPVTLLQAIKPDERS